MKDPVALLKKIFYMNRFLYLFGFSIVCLLLSAQTSISQQDRWQQRVKYFMDIHMNVSNNRFTGKQRLEYTNNSPDTLFRVFYHLYWNAFQPNSMMDAHSRELGKIIVGRRQDWDTRVKDRILNLKPDEIGYQKILSLKMNGVAQSFKEEETILEVKLNKPILPKSTVIFDMEFEAQVPLQVRRSGRDNPQNTVRYSMSQWYPKICEYDYQGWHSTPYVAREFYGVWGDFDVKITIDKNYIIGGTGYLQNPAQIGYGYENPGTKVTRPAGDQLTWHFFAPNVHDFMWAADPEFKHKSLKVRNDLTLHVLYKISNAPESDWLKILETASKALPYIEKTFGPYPYKQYSFVHGGDDGMEYPMATLLNQPAGWMHEWMHSWYQGMLATNELEYPWMDEGFTQYAGARVWGFLNNDTVPSSIFKKEYEGYFGLVKINLQEPLTTYADYFNTNFSYNVSSYYKGAIFLEQLGYIVGDEVRDKILLEYYRQWRFKHPDVVDFFHIAEKVSNMKLDWYRDFWVNSIKTIDYSIDSLWEEGGRSKIRLRMIGKMPMPIDVLLQYKDGTKAMAYIPQYSMFGEKPVEDKSIPRQICTPWKWTDPTYTFEINRRLTDLKIIEIDPTQRMADINRSNNKLELSW